MMFVDGHYAGIVSALPAALLRYSESRAHKLILLLQSREAARISNYEIIITQVRFPKLIK